METATEKPAITLQAGVVAVKTPSPLFECKCVCEDSVRIRFNTHSSIFQH